MIVACSRMGFCLQQLMDILCVDTCTRFWRAMNSVVAGAIVVSVASAKEASPIAEVIQMVSDLETKVIAEGEACHKTCEESAKRCEDNSKNVTFEHCNQ